MSARRVTWPPDMVCAWLITGDAWHNLATMPVSAAEKKHGILEGLWFHTAWVWLWRGGRSGRYSDWHMGNIGTF